MFEAGQTYSARSACDHEARFTFNVTRRTAKSVWLDDGETVRRVAIHKANGQEIAFPMGRYSMAPVLRA